jgi:hypothetical protein
MSNRNIGLEILKGIREIKAHKRGKRKLRVIKITKPAAGLTKHSP